MKTLKSKIVILSIATAAGSIICAVRNENAYIAIAGIALAATYGAIAKCMKVKQA